MSSSIGRPYSPQTTSGGLVSPGESVNSPSPPAQPGTDPGPPPMGRPPAAMDTAARRPSLKPPPLSPGLSTPSQTSGSSSPSTTGSPQSTQSTASSTFSASGLLARRKRSMNFHLDIAALEVRKRRKVEEVLPAELSGRRVTFSSDRLGNGSNAVVLAVKVDGVVSSRFVGKVAILGTKGESERAMEMLDHEVEVHAALRKLGLDKNAPGLLVAAGSLKVDGQSCLLLPRVHGEPLVKHVDRMYVAAMQSETRPADFVLALRQALTAPLKGLAALHAAGWVMNDLNTGNLMHGQVGGPQGKPHGVLIDMGCADREGAHRRPGAISTLAPERIESSDEPGTGERQHPLTPAADAYSLGCVLHCLVHRRYPSWVAAAHQDDEATLLELSAAAQDFFAKGTLIEDSVAWSKKDMRDDNGPERTLRAALHDSGFYELVEGLTRPDPKRRWTVETALASPFMSPARSPSARGQGTDDSRQLEVC